MTPSLLDKAVNWISPERGLRRLRAKAALEVAQKLAYEGASTGRNLENWHRPSTSANAEVGVALVRLRNGSRDLFRNNPLARKAIKEIQTKCVGTGILPRSRAASKRTRKYLDETFQIWMEECDLLGRLKLPGIQSLAVKTIIESGEALIRRRRLQLSRDQALPLRLQLLEPDYMDMNKSHVVSGGGFVLQGVEFDQNEQRTGYWLFDTHPGEAINANWWRQGGGVTSRFVPASEILHGYEMERAGQVHGVPRCAPVIVAMRHMDELDEAIRVRKRVEACFSVFIYNADSEVGGIGVAGKDSSGQKTEVIEPGLIQYLNGNKEVKFAEPTSSGAEPDYMRLQQRLIAAGWQIPYEILTGDLSQINYSSYRGGLLGFKDMITEFRENVVLPFVCDPIWRWFVDECVQAGIITEPDYDVEWSEPKFDLLDREKEAAADEKMMRIGTMTWPQAVSAQGWDPDRQLQVIQETNQKFDDAGIILDCDPRKTTSGGKAVQPPTTEPSQTQPTGAQQ